MARLRTHSSVIKLKEAVETEEYYILVMELMRGGDLFDRLHMKEVFSEDETRRTMQQIATAVKHLHENGIAHRDLKIENIMFTSPASDELKLGDFGLAKDLGRSDSNTPVGTLHYMVSFTVHPSPLLSSPPLPSPLLLMHLLGVSWHSLLSLFLFSSLFLLLGKQRAMPTNIPPFLTHLINPKVEIFRLLGNYPIPPSSLLSPSPSYPPLSN